MMMKPCIYGPGKIRAKAKWIMAFFLVYWTVQSGPAFAGGHLNSPAWHNALEWGGPKTDSAAFKVLVLYENGGHHLAYSRAAIPFISQWARENHFSVHYLQDPATIDSTLLTRYRLFIQLDYPPYSWPKKAMLAFKSFITEGKIGWLGFHHATLLGEFDGYPMWDWFSWFMGGIRFQNYVADFAAAYVDICDKAHPVMQGVSPRFLVKKEEWYTYDTVPGDYIHVLATVDESSYRPDTNIKMHGLHPVVWTNTSVKARNLYVFMGHDPALWENSDYKRLFWNALFWSAGQRPIHRFSGTLKQ
ncbi:ThuA domain-containing protein [Arachidicoccus terrestris]|uniref:ThuA domain-containing protein n=1 Tax=Arachidicoccus terrestris TaxID=2875539 RepID=UPI001CC7D3D4|nr:ThuA domain-containing protein [Arachidicoccus terrestris]UAY54148.1 ThuA domain-containing protein [Arachidicoccus terrestris]